MSKSEHIDRCRLATSREEGFSLIELLIAATVTTFGLVSVVGLVSYVSRTNATSNALNVLATAAQDQVDRLRTAVWTMNNQDPTISEGGSLSGSTYSLSSFDGTSSDYLYLYTLDPDDPHHAQVSNTPAGDLDIRWQVRQGSTPDLRYVTIRVIQVNAPPLLSNGFTVTTIICRDQ